MTFEEWWKTEGQFMPPLDRVGLFSHTILDHYKEFARKVWEAREEEVEEAYNRGLDEAELP